MCLTDYYRHTETDRDFKFSILGKILKTLLNQYRLNVKYWTKNLENEMTAD